MAIAMVMVMVLALLRSMLTVVTLLGAMTVCIVDDGTGLRRAGNMGIFGAGRT